MNASTPRPRPRPRPRSVAATIARGSFVAKVLRSLATTTRGLSFSELLREMDDDEQLLRVVLKELENNRQVHVYDGVIFGITPQGRERLEPAKCVNA